ncbi:type II glyceraldehyde-3-phosphate dehydrogenase [archaeon SCG-AAA382B04]|nr:type II glyceraldehyde-3-phosphate dehydrogenase [archaeon SCG-AAA382B04]
MKPKVAVNGYGTIGKRVADAVQMQDDIELTGVTKTHPDYEGKIANENSYGLYSAIPEKVSDFKESEVEIQGDIHDLLGKSDIVVDCSPGGIGAKNKELYEKKDIKAIFQGGEDHEVAGFSFNTLVNYEEAIDRDFLRVVSCNTTALCRTLSGIHKNFEIEKVRATMIRRGGDPNQDSRGPLNAIIPKLEVPSHHGHDVQTVIPSIEIETLAVKVPTTIMHLHAINIEFDKNLNEEEIISILEETPRVSLIDEGLEIDSTSQLIEVARDKGRKRNDLMEIPIWKEAIGFEENELSFFQAVHQESDVVPENIDAIRAMFDLERDYERAIEKTNKNIKLKKIL